MGEKRHQDQREIIQNLICLKKAPKGEPKTKQIASKIDPKMKRELKWISQNQKQDVRTNHEFMLNAGSKQSILLNKRKDSEQHQLRISQIVTNFWDPFGKLLGYFWQAFGSRGRAWEGCGDALGRVSEKSRNNASFKALPAAPWGPLRRLWTSFDSLFGASGRPFAHFFIRCFYNVFLTNLRVSFGYEEQAFGKAKVCQSVELFEEIFETS